LPSPHCVTDNVNIIGATPEGDQALYVSRLNPLNFGKDISVTLLSRKNGRAVLDSPLSPV
jgi:hypothetical protein